MRIERDAMEVQCGQVQVSLKFDFLLSKMLFCKRKSLINEMPLLRLQSKITELEKHLLSNRSASAAASSGTNIEYVRNVLLKLLVTKDKKQRQFMINALLTALDAKDPTNKSETSAPSHSANSSSVR